MNLKQLQLFLEVANAGSLSKAAIVTHKSQPILSRQISDFEGELGTLLFHRTGHGVALTEAGALLRSRAEHILDQVRQAQREVRGLGRMQLTRATIALPPTVARLVIKDLMQALLSEYPELELHMRESPSGTILNWVLEKKVDVAVLYDTVAIPRMLGETFFEEPLYVVTRPGAGPAPDTMPVHALAGAPLVLPGKQEGLRALLDAAASKAGIELRPAVEADALPMIKQLVEAGYGYAMLPRSAIRDELNNGSLVASRLIEPEVSRSLVLATTTERIPSTGLNALTRIVRRVTLEALEKS